MTNKSFDDAKNDFVATLTDYLTSRHAARYPSLPPKFIELMDGPRQKYIRIVDGYGNHRSCFGFIDKTNGDILFSAGWAGPSKKHPRGNVFSDQKGMEAIEGDCIRYLRH